MAYSERQNNLFAAEDWKVAYKAFNEVDFTSYDFDTIRLSMVNYIKANFPENFNDYIESSEFIAIIELLAYLAQALAFRMDLNSRENFLETAERRDSVFKLARMLGYNPRRNVPASGLLKVTSISTDEPIVDSLGTNLSNTPVFWDDVNNPESYEQFITILNSAFSNTNRFTNPYKSGTIQNIKTELYRINKQINSNQQFPFSLNVNGVNRSFEVVDGDFVDNNFFFERHPDPLNDLGLFYRNDGLGLDSNNTGFFMLFKQGTTSSVDFNFTAPIPNRIQDVEVSGINETDFWVQEINPSGSIINKWSKIPNTVGQTLNFNSQAFGSRNLFALENLNNDAVRIKFPDGNFGNVPTGIFRVFFRTSDGVSYSIQPEEARNVTVTVPYENKTGGKYNLTFTLALQNAVTNSLPTESLASIKSRAPQTYYTQNRMVSAQDYNVFPFSQSSNIRKLKAVNKTHAGHSRYIDINDPTGTFQSIDLYADDGILYKDSASTNTFTIINQNNTADNFITNILPELLKEQSLNNFNYESQRKAWINYKGNSFDLESLDITWRPLPVAPTSSTGYITETTSVSAAGSENVLTNQYFSFRQLQENNFIKWFNPDNISEYKWTRIINVDNAGLLTSGLSTAVGPWTLSDNVPDGWKAQEVIVTLRKRLTNPEVIDVRTAMESKKTFGLGYAPTLVSTSLYGDTWYVIENENLDKTSAYSVVNAGKETGSPIDSSWILLFEYEAIDENNYKYNITLRGDRYIVQSNNNMKFFNISNVKVVDSNNKAASDIISITTFNNKPGDTERWTWYDTGSNNIGDAWYSTETAALVYPVDYALEIPLRSRETKWYDIRFKWQSNFGILRPNGQDVANTIVQDILVNDARVEVSTYFDDGTAAALTPNVTIANNLGRINRIPSNITIPFNNVTFGYNIYTSNGNVVYKQLNSGTNQVEIYQANIDGNTYSYGVTGTLYNASAVGSLVFSDGNVSAESGNLIYANLDDNNYLYVTDSTGQRSVDSILIEYNDSTERLNDEIDWHIVGTIKQPDGYTDNSKAIVAPLDSDNDLVPDRPLQYDEFVGENNLVYFEEYTDFDGYTYDQLSIGGIADFRGETKVVINYIDETLVPSNASEPVAISDLKWIVVDLYSILTTDLENDNGILKGIYVYVVEQDKVYTLLPSSTNANEVRGIETQEYYVKNGRGFSQNTLSPQNIPMIFKWQHVAPQDSRVNPSISNVVEYLVLTETYNSEIQKYLNVPGTEFPLPPTNDDLAVEFIGLNEYKSASDTLLFKSAKFKRLFGDDAEPEYRAKFRVVKLNDTVSDNEIKTQVKNAIDEYFDTSNWDFGETFYFTELSTYIHNRLRGNIGSIVILPKNTAGKFGDMFSVRPDPDELFLSTAKTIDIEIISNISNKTLS